MEKKSRNFKEYKIWRDAVDFATEIYKITGEMPWFEKKGLCDQLQRAAVSISSNIAEGSAHPSNTDFAHFLDMALGSASEVETQLLIAKNVGYVNEDIYANLNGKIIEMQKQLNGLLRLLRSLQN